MGAIVHGDVGLTSARTRARMVNRLRVAGIGDERVLGRMNTVRRHVFLESAVAAQAYDDVAVPIGFGQTMSKPWVVARMSELALNGRERVNTVLDIGCGSGYQAAILAGFARKVIAVERIGALKKRAEQAFVHEGITNIALFHGDGFNGHAQAGGFDIIMVAAAPANVPQALINQLAIGGRMIIPVGGQKQHLEVIERMPSGPEHTLHDAVHFVPMLEGVR